jgi:hypothetical protein
MRRLVGVGEQVAAGIERHFSRAVAHERLYLLRIVALPIHREA